MGINDSVDALLKKANDGDADAMVDVAFRYLTGNGVDNNVEIAFLWASKSAKLGSRFGHYLLGEFYLYGWSQNKDESKAYTCYKAAAKRGVQAAHKQLAQMCLYGIGIKKSYSKSDYHFKQYSDTAKFLKPLYTKKLNVRSRLTTCLNLLNIDSIVTDFIVSKYPTDINNDLAHYTTIGAIRSILNPDTTHNKTNRCLRLYNVMYMNDPQEGKALLDYSKQNDKEFNLHKFYESSANWYPENNAAECMVYCASFTESADSLDLWRMYSPNSDGICITIPPNAIKNLAAPKMKLTDTMQPTMQLNNLPTPSLANLRVAIKPKPEFRLIKVMYSDEDMNEILKLINNNLKQILALFELRSSSNHLKETASEAVRIVLLDIMYMFKHYHYKTENEYRLICLKNITDVEMDDRFKLFTTTPDFLFAEGGYGITFSPKVTQPANSRLEIEYRIAKTGSTQPSFVKISDIKYR